MTKLEKDEIVSYVLSYLKSNSISINELRKVDSLIGLEHFSALKKEADGSYDAVKFDLNLLYPVLRLNNGNIEYKDLSTNTWIVLISQEELPPIEVDGSTLGGLTNVNNEVDVQDAQDVFLVKSAESNEWGKRNVKDFTGKDGVIAYPTMFLNPLTGRLILQVPTNNYENRFAVRNGHLMLIQS